MNSDEPVQLPRRDFDPPEDEGDRIDRIYDQRRDEEITRNIEGEEDETIQAQKNEFQASRKET